MFWLRVFRWGISFNIFCLHTKKNKFHDDIKQKKAPHLAFEKQETSTFLLEKWLTHRLILCKSTHGSTNWLCLIVSASASIFSVTIQQSMYQDAAPSDSQALRSSLCGSTVYSELLGCFFLSVIFRNNVTLSSDIHDITYQDDDEILQKLQKDLRSTWSWSLNLSNLIYKLTVLPFSVLNKRP